MVVVLVVVVEAVVVFTLFSAKWSNSTFVMCLVNFVYSGPYM